MRRGGGCRIKKIQVLLGEGGYGGGYDYFTPCPFSHFPFCLRTLSPFFRSEDFFVHHSNSLQSVVIAGGGLSHNFRGWLGEVGVTVGPHSNDRSASIRACDRGGARGAGKGVEEIDMAVGEWRFTT